jgi:hypothetical protein
LSKIVESLEGLGLHTHDIVLELLDHGVDVLGNWSCLELLLDLSANYQ